jgi:hypothetical protein
VAGGAIYALGAKSIVVANSTFRGNTAANGGAIGTLQTASFIYNAVFENNQAVGQGANGCCDNACGTFNGAGQTGAGGLGGALYQDGEDTDSAMCGVRMSDSKSNDLGGAVFTSRYWAGSSPKQTITWDKCTFERNKSGTTNGGGAAYVNNCLFTVKNSTFTGNDANGNSGGGLMLTGTTIAFDTVSFTNNVAAIGGGVALWSGGPDGVGTATNITFSGNTPNDYAGDFPKPQ